MSRLIAFAAVGSLLCLCPAYSKEKRKTRPNINKSKEYANVYHSPSAEATPKVFRSVLQMEVVVKKGDSEAKVLYANGTVVSKDGLIVSVLAQPGAENDESGGIVSAALLFLDGKSAPVKLVAYEPAYGLAIFRAKGLDLPPLPLSKAPLVANRLVNWHTVFKIGGKRTFLYTRPLRIDKTAYAIGETKDLCRIIDRRSSSLSAARSGSALVALDGTLVAVMGRLKHWHVTPKNSPRRLKLAWAVPASVIARLVEKANGK